MTELDRKRLGMGHSKLMNMPKRKRSTDIQDALANKIEMFCLEMTTLKCCRKRKMKKESFKNEF